ncbi:hypothetical protein PR048_032255 [Dryococelus australis]|uniref:Uncharacterized protein n=1 Tax=Dryococelus australis TaxID=614101 RepID=A0ABQ9G4Q4_9NEOP|nr:hypothetical protein PR048_032255 [Dryococelus australis]
MKAVSTWLDTLTTFVSSAEAALNAVDDKTRRRGGGGETITACQGKQGNSSKRKKKHEVGILERKIGSAEGRRGLGGRAISTLASHQGEPGSIPGRVTGFSQVGIVPDDAVGRRAFSGIPCFPRPSIPAPLHNHFNHPHRQISSLTHYTPFRISPCKVQIYHELAEPIFCCHHHFLIEGKTYRSVVARHHGHWISERKLLARYRVPMDCSKSTNGLFLPHGVLRAPWKIRCCVPRRPVHSRGRHPQTWAAGANDESTADYDKSTSNPVATEHLFVYAPRQPAANTQAVEDDVLPARYRPQGAGGEYRPFTRQNPTCRFSVVSVQDTAANLHHSQPRGRGTGDIRRLKVLTTRRRVKAAKHER